jgi:DnaJ-class molecular chaperone
MNVPQTKTITFAILLALSLSMMTVGEVRATGPFDQTCPNCNGAGTITRDLTVTCPACQGVGSTTSQHTCDKCSGTGKITVTTTCSACGGNGSVSPSVAVKATNGYGTLSGLDWVARCEITLQNEEDEGTYCVVESHIHTVTNDYYKQSPRTYLQPHTDKKITVDTKEVGLTTDFTYGIYIKSVDSITCKVCQGSGGSSTIATCDRCSGTGVVTETNTCNNCHGAGQITVQDSITCSTCDGSGYVANWSTISIVGLGIAVLIIVGSIGAFTLNKRKLPQQH